MAHRSKRQKEELSLAERGRLGFGDYVPYEGIKIARAREYFIEAVERLTDTALIELSHEPYCLYMASGILNLDLTRARREYRPDSIEDEPEFRNGNDLWDVWEHLKRRKPYQGVLLTSLSDSLFDWAKRHHLDTDWCVRHALYTLDQWSKYPSHLGQLNWARFPDIIIYGKYQEDIQNSSIWPEPPTGFERWLPSSETRADYIRNLTSRHFKPLLRRAGLPEVRLYDLRHTCATLLLSANEHPKVVSERLGHASITLTLDTYSHVLPSMQQAATEKLENLLFG